MILTIPLSIMETLSDYISKELAKIGIAVSDGSFQKYQSGGVASDVYTAHSNKGKLIIHVKGSYEEQFRQRVHEKIYWISQLLKNHRDIPTAQVFLAGTLPSGKLFTVQEFIEGEPLGTRVFKEADIVDVIFAHKRDFFIREVQRFLGKFHEISLPGYGFLFVKNGVLRGEHTSWMDFLHSGSEAWLNNVYSNQSEYQRWRDQLRKFFETYEDQLQYTATGRFLTMDITNPGNVLIKDGRVIALIDFEWAAVGDPAWEFAFMKNEYLGDYYQYFEERGDPIDRELFELKRTLYRVLWLLFAIHVWVGKSLAAYLRSEFEKDLVSALNAKKRP